MEKELLRRIILDQRETIQKSLIHRRAVVFEEKANYVLVGPRRAGKTTILYQRALDMVGSGTSWDQIVFVNFEDDRLSEMGLSDLDALFLLGKEMAGEGAPIFFLDEIQNIEGWEKFARRLGDSNYRVYITGSNAHMLSREIESRLGGRFLTMDVHPYDFREYAGACNVDVEGASSADIAKRNALLRTFFQYGGFPATLDFKDKKEYVSSIYQKILLGDIVSRHSIRNVNSIRILMKKVAETVGSEVSYTHLYNLMKGIGFSLAKDSIIDYCSYAEEAFLIFKTENYYASFLDKQSHPRFYFTDNGLLNLFVLDHDSAMLENLVALTLKNRFKDDLYYIKSAKTGIDVDFFLPEEELSIQACYSLKDSKVLDRETKNLSRLVSSGASIKKAMIVTYEERGTIESEGCSIEVIPLLDFLISF